MPIASVITSQTGGRRFEGDKFNQYSHFVGGLNSTYHALLNYSPQVTGYPRLFMVRQPIVMSQYFGGPAGSTHSAISEFMQFKHAMEYMLAGFNGLGDITLETTGTQLQGGPSGRAINIPSVTRDTTDTVTTRLYEMSGSLIFSVVDTWMNMISDMNSGYSTYGGLISNGKNSEGRYTRLYNQTSGDTRVSLPYNEANHTAEFIYILTDRSGLQVERAWLLADCFPKSISQATAADYTPGQHDLVAYDVQWNCSVYRSPIITSIADDLLRQYTIVSNYLNFNPQLGDAVYTANGDTATVDTNGLMGGVPSDANAGTSIGNMPTFNPDVVRGNPKVVSTITNMTNYKKSGQGENPYARNITMNDVEAAAATRGFTPDQLVNLINNSRA